MADLDKIRVRKTDTIYDIKDATARAAIEGLATVASTGDYEDLENLPGLGTAAFHDVIGYVAEDSPYLPMGGAVHEAIQTAISSAYKPAGNKTCAELTSSLLVAANRGNVYNITTTGTTTADFVEGAGKPIDVGDNVGICEPTSGVYKFDLLAGFIDTSGFQTKNLSQAIAGASTVEGALSAINTEVGTKQDVLTFDQTPTDQSQNPVKSDGIYDAFVGAYGYVDAGLGWSCKNLLKIINSGREVNGITYTVNEDGTVKLNGTASAASIFTLNKFTGAELKEYGQDLWMSGGKDTSTFLTLATEDWAYTKDDKGNGVEIKISQLTDATEYFAIIQVASGTTLSNYIMSPMIRLASVLDPSFKKYHDPVDKVLEGKANASDLIQEAQTARGVEAILAEGITAVDGKIGDITELDSDNKTNVVSALNEVIEKTADLQNFSGSQTILDSSGNEILDSSNERILDVQVGASGIATTLNNMVSWFKNTLEHLVMDSGYTVTKELYEILNS